MMATLLLAHLVVGLAIVGTGRRLGRRAIWPALLPPVATLVWLATSWSVVTGGGTVEEVSTWVPQLGLAVDLRLDGFAALMVLLVSGIGVLVLVYARSYFPTSSDGLGRLIGLLTLFAGAMLGLVLADNLLVLYGFWELTSVTSFFLIGNRSTSARARAAALQALLITGAGALAMLVGFILIGQAGGTYRLSALLASPPDGTTVTVGLLLVAIGAASKSAQYPFHSWLPGAMVAPTPVSAYLHSATMVKAGVYLVARFTPAFGSVPIWRWAVIGVGATSMVLGGLRALRQTDLKLVLAHGTVSQLGFMFVLFGVGTPEALTAGCVLLLAHAAFKAALFMSVGVVDRTLSTRDITRLPRIGGAWPAFAAVAVVSAASMAGLPPLLGFVAKEAGYEALLHSGLARGALVLGVVVAASMLTFAYSARFVLGTLFGVHDVEVAGDRGPLPNPARGFLVAPVVLGGFTVVAGLAPFLLDGVVSAARTALAPGTEPVHLALWHGLNAALALSAVTIAGGVLVALLSGRAATSVTWGAWGSRVPSGSAVYLWLLRGVNRLADRVTGVVQSGSLPVYVGVILSATTILPAVVLLRDVPAGAFDVGTGDTATMLATALLVGIMIAAAITAATIRRRYAAALLLAGVGYAMAGLFVVQGAPDLALTTVAVESLFTVVFVLVLRSLPDRFEQRSTRSGRVFRLLVSGAVGAVVFLFALVAAGERLPSTASRELIERSLPDGHGRNVVNVILVDFRGFDTLGELTVLAAASIGAVALARAVRRPGRPPAGSGARAEARSGGGPG